MTDLFTAHRGVDTQTEEKILARLYGEPLEECPDGLYIPPEALRVFLESFEGPLDLLLYLIRKQKFDVMDIPMAELTDQERAWSDGELIQRFLEHPKLAEAHLVRESDLELAAAYLVMSATLMQIKSRLLLPSVRTAEGTEPEDPRAELMRRLEEYERIRSAALKLQAMPRIDRDFRVAEAERCVPVVALQPDVTPEMLASAWAAVAARLKLRDRHKVSRQELSVREHMTALLKRLQTEPFVTLEGLWNGTRDRETMTVWFLALLELAKEGMIILTQGAPYAPLYATLPEDAGTLELRCPDPDPLVLTS